MRWGWVLVVVGVLLAGCGTPPPPFDPGVAWLIRGGRVWTGDPAQPFAEAVAVRNEKIVQIGSAAACAAAAGPGTQIVELNGRLVVPGFIDAHVHFLEGGGELQTPELRSSTSVRDLSDRLGAWARTQPPGTWLTGPSWDHERWPGAALPTRWDIDGATGGMPVFVRRTDGHMALANSAALQLAGITSATPDPAGGVIVRDGRGEPTGILRDTAMDLVESRIPPLSDAVVTARLAAALEHAAANGVTGIHDMGTDLRTLEAYRALRDRGELTTRVTVYLPIDAMTPKAARGLRLSHADFAWLNVAGVKAFADGSLGSSTALFVEPYADQPSTSGLALADLKAKGRLEEQIVAFCGELFQPAIHAIGDRANNEVLDLLRRVDREATHPFHPPFREFRIEHAQHLLPEDIGRFQRYGVIASMQPYHAIDDGRWADRKLGPKRAQTTYAFRSLLDQGAVLAFGSDWPVAPLSPLLGIYAAATRQTLDGRHPDGWVPEQKIAVEEALKAYTQGSARAAMVPKESGIGRLVVGGAADLVVVDRDILAIDPAQIRDAGVDLTMVAGRVVFRRR